MEQYLPSESEWKIMEQLWESDRPLTTIEIQEGISKSSSMSLKTVRVLTNRLLNKGLIGFEVDKDDKRVYHYHPIAAKEECERAKSRSFIDNYFAGDQTSAVAALIETCQLTEEQFRELEAILENSKNSGSAKQPPKHGSNKKTGKGK